MNLVKRTDFHLAFGLTAALAAGSTALGACSSTTSGDPAPKTKGFVMVSLTQDVWTEDDGSTTPVVYAQLDTYPTTSSTPSTTREKIGPCEAVMRPFVTSDAGAADATAAPRVDQFGGVTVKGGNLPPEGLTITPDSNSDNVMELRLKAWNGGEDLTFEATAGTAPAFSGKIVKTPNDIQVASPAPESDGKVAIDRTADLVVRWTGGGAGIVSAVVSSRDPAAQKRTTIFCQFPAADGQGVVPTKLLQHLQQTDDAGVRGSLSVSPESYSDFVSGDWDVSLSVGGRFDFHSVRVTK